MSNRPKQPRRVEGRRFGNASIPFHRRVAVGPVPRPPVVRNDAELMTVPVVRPASTRAGCSSRSDRDPRTPGRMPTIRPLPTDL